MRILILVESLVTGGTASSLLNLLHHLRDSRIKIDIYVLDNSGADSNRLKMLPENVRVIRIREIDQLNYYARNQCDRIKLLIKSGAVWETMLRRFMMLVNGKKYNRKNDIVFRQKQDIKIAKTVKNIDFVNEYDCVISWCEFLLNYVLALKISSKRRLAWVHPEYMSAGFSSKIDSKVFELLDGIVTVSKSAKGSLTSVFPQLKERIFCVPNVLNIVNVRKKSNAPLNQIQQNESFTIVTVARIECVSKAFDRGLRVMQRLEQGGHDFHWIIVGDGPDRITIEQQAKDLGIEEHITLVGHQSNPYPYMKHADVFLLQSYYEGMPMVVNEALLLGTPVVVTRYASASEQVLDGITGLIVDNTEQAVFEKLEELLQNPSVLLTIKGNLSSFDFSYLEDFQAFIEVIKAN